MPIFIGRIVHIAASLIDPLKLSLHKMRNLVNQSIAQTEYLEKVRDLRVFSINLKPKLRNQGHKHSNLLFDAQAKVRSYVGFVAIPDKSMKVLYVCLIETMLNCSTDGYNVRREKWFVV